MTNIFCFKSKEFKKDIEQIKGILYLVIFIIQFFVISLFRLTYILILFPFLSFVLLICALVSCVKNFFGYIDSRILDEIKNIVNFK